MEFKTGDLVEILNLTNSQIGDIIRSQESIATGETTVRALIGMRFYVEITSPSVCILKGFKYSRAIETLFYPYQLKRVDDK